MTSSTATPVTAQPSGMSDNFIACTSLAFLRRDGGDHHGGCSALEWLIRRQCAEEGISDVGEVALSDNLGTGIRRNSGPDGSARQRNPVNLA
ncbi:hypothetical protein ACFQ0M_14660 [Kitasatospora aburaviensis]